MIAPTTNKQKKASAVKPLKWILKTAISIGAVVVIGLWAWTLLPKIEDSLAERTESKKGKIAEVAPAASQIKQEEPPPPPALPQVETNVFVKRPGALQLPNGKVITFNPPAPGEEKTIWVQGRKYTVDSEGNFRDDSPKHTFDNRFENTMEAMSAVGGGCLPATALSIKQEDIAKYMASPIVINDNDPQDIVEKKIATAEMKELFRDYLKEGGTWEEFVMELSHIKRTEHLLNSQAIGEIARMLREGDEEGAQMYREKADEFMKSKGYRGLKVPKAWGLGVPQD